MKFCFFLLICLVVTTGCESISIRLTDKYDNTNSNSAELRLRANNGVDEKTHIQKHSVHSKILVPGRIRSEMTNGNKVFAGWCSNLPCNDISDRTHLAGEFLMLTQSLDLYALWLEPSAPDWENMMSGDLVIPSPVTSIADSAFNKDISGANLSSLVLSDSITSIGDFSFRRNDLLSLTIPDSVTHIGTCAFEHSQLSNIVIPPSVTRIKQSAFGFGQLTSVVLSGSEMDIESNAFGSNQISDVVISGSLKTFNGSVFMDNPLKNVLISGSMDTIGRFVGTPFDNLVISGSINSITNSAFAGYQLKSLTITGKVSHINNGAFAGNQLTTISLPDSILSVGSGSFITNPVSSISLGAEVTLEPGSFPNDFNLFYDAQGKKKGTYIWNGSNWEIQAIP